MVGMWLYGDAARLALRRADEVAPLDRSQEPAVGASLLGFMPRRCLGVLLKSMNEVEAPITSIDPFPEFRVASSALALVYCVVLSLALFVGCAPTLFKLSALVLVAVVVGALLRGVASLLFVVPASHCAIVHGMIAHGQS